MTATAAEMATLERDRKDLREQDRAEAMRGEDGELGIKGCGWVGLTQAERGKKGDG